MGDNNILLSVVVPVYGHENYISHALNSILMQEVNFNYEIIVGEDCSPDGTREILYEYERKYSERFVMIYRDKNIGMFNNMRDLIMRCRGKYIAYLEGDDFWTSNHKLQMQVDYLESHEECIATAHRTIVVDEYENVSGERYPECKSIPYTLHHFRKGLYPGQSSTIVCRNIYNNSICDSSIFDYDSLVPCDIVKAFILASLGSVYCFPEIMSGYRHVTNHGTSYSATLDRRRKNHYLAQIKYYHTIMVFSKNSMNNEAAVRTIESVYFWAVARSFIIKYIDWKVLCSAFGELMYKKSAIQFVFSQIVSWPIRSISNKLRGEM